MDLCSVPCNNIRRWLLRSIHILALPCYSVISAGDTCRMLPALLKVFWGCTGRDGAGDRLRRRDTSSFKWTLAWMKGMISPPLEPKRRENSFALGNVVP